MRHLFIKIIRDFIAKPWRIIGLIASISLGIGIYGGVYSALESVPQMTDKFYAKTAFADLEIMFLSEDKDNIPNLSDIPGIARVEYRLILPGTITKKDKSSLSGLLVLLENNPTINSLEMTEGEIFNKINHEFVIENSLRKIHKFTPLDSITIKIGEKMVGGKISGIAISPEFLSMSSNPNFSNPEKGTLGVIFGDVSYFNDALGFTLVNDIVVKFSPNADIQKAKEMLLNKLSGLNIDRVSSQQRQFSHQQISFYLILLRNYSGVLVFILLVLSGLLALITCNRFIIEQRKELGALLAIGYSRFQIVTSYGLGGLIIGVISGFVGCVFAIITMPIMTCCFGIFIGLPFIKNYLTSSILIICTILAVTIAIISLLGPLFLLLRKMPSKIIRQSLSEKLILESLFGAVCRSFMSGSVGFIYGLRNLFRRPIMAIFSILVIASAIGLSIGYGVCLTSYYKGMDASLNQEQWDEALDFYHPVFPEDIEVIRQNSTIEKISPYFRGFVEIGNNGHFIDSRMLGYIPADSMRKTALFKGRMFIPGKNETVVSRDICEDIKVNIGQMLTLKYQTQVDSLLIVGMTADLNLRQILTDIDKARFINGFESRSNGAYIRLHDKKTPFDQKSSLIAKTTSFDHLKNVMYQNMNDLIMLVYVTSAYSYIMLVVFILMFVNLSIEERKTEYATLLSLGYENKAIAKIMFSEIFTQVALSVVMSIPAAIVIALFLNEVISGSFFEIIFAYRFQDFALPIICAIGPAAISGIFTTRAILKMNIVSALRARDIN